MAIRYATNLSQIDDDDGFLMTGVNLSKNKIGPKGVVSVVELLRTNSTLLVYALNDNENLGRFCPLSIPAKHNRLTIGGIR